VQATAYIRGKEKQSGAHIPIVDMTAHAMKGDRERCLGAAWTDTFQSQSLRVDWRKRLRSHRAFAKC
jgi:two-component system sensor histidine kinase/response regulator